MSSHRPNLRFETMRGVIGGTNPSARAFRASSEKQMRQVNIRQTLLRRIELSATVRAAVLALRLTSRVRSPSAETELLEPVQSFPCPVICWKCAP